MKDVATILKETKKAMSETIDFLDDKLAKIRAGKANPKLLDDIRVNYYGNPTPVSYTHLDTHHADAEDDADTDPHHHAVLVQAVAQTAYLHKFGVERGVE